jgi:hypothetical protein
MKILSLPLLFFTIVITIINCKSNTSEKNTPIKKSTQWQMDSLVVKGNEYIDQGDTLQPSVKLFFPKYLGTAHDSTYINAIQEAQLSNLNSVAFFETEEYQQTLANAIDSFINPGDIYEYRNFFESTVDSLFQSDSITSLCVHNFFYTGGAHPNTTLTIFNFDNISGNQIDIKSAILDTVNLKKIVYEAFQKNEIQELNTKTFEPGSYFMENGFFLPQNMAITSDGLQFLYQKYEIASYARGEIIFTVPWSQLKGLLDKSKIYLAQ